MASVSAGELVGEELAGCDFAERERQLLRHARRLLREGGYDHLTINRLSQRSGLSRMTLYKHFANRHDIVLKLAVQSTARRADLVERAVLFKASTRERLAAVIDVSRVMMPHHMRHEILIFEDGILDKASPELLLTLRSHEDRIIAAIVGVVREAVVAGDVTLPAEITITGDTARTGRVYFQAKPGGYFYVFELKKEPDGVWRITKSSY